MDNSVETHRSGRHGRLIVATVRAALVVAVCVAAGACSKPESQPPTSSTPAVPPEPELSSTTAPNPVDAALPRWQGDLDSMIERRVIRVLTTYSKTQYFVDQATQRGLVYDAFMQFETDLNKRLKIAPSRRVHVVFLPVSAADLTQALLEGRGDVVAAGRRIIDAHRTEVDFTTPTRTGVSAIVVTHRGSGAVTRVEDLAGREVYLRRSSLAPGALEAFNARLAAAKLPNVRVRTAPDVLADEDILEMVNAGLVEATIAYDHIAEFWQQVLPNLVLNTSAAVATDVELGMSVRKGSPKLLAELNAFIARYPEGSALRNVLLRKYLKDVTYVKEATSGESRDRFERTVRLFRQYGGQYDLNYLLVMAQAYQESRLDQNARSQVGAVGVMQIMPATGRDMRVGDIRQLEPNIHAGAKYVRFMIDRYYANEPMTPVDKMLFAFASYNAGPARIASLRQQAAQRGLDPNVWFNNVETVTARSVGLEPVRYVANIYKYFLAYQMLEEQRQRREEARKTSAG